MLSYFFVLGASMHTVHLEDLVSLGHRVSQLCVLFITGCPASPLPPWLPGLSLGLKGMLLCATEPHLWGVGGGAGWIGGQQIQASPHPSPTSPRPRHCLLYLMLFLHHFTDSFWTIIFWSALNFLSYNQNNFFSAWRNYIESEHWNTLYKVLMFQEFDWNISISHLRTA